MRTAQTTGIRAFIIGAIVFGAIAAMAITATPQKNGPGVDDWKREHSGHPYVGAEVHFVLDSGPNLGHPRPAVVTRVYDHQRADLVVFLSAKDFTDSVTVASSALPVLAVEEAAPDSGGNPGTWHWPLDPKEYRSTGQ